MRRYKMCTDEYRNIKETEGLYKNLTYKIISALYDIHNELGPVHKEIVYHKAIAIELNNRDIDFTEEGNLPIIYKGHVVGTYKPDFIIEDKVILELKVVPAISKAAFDQVYYYIKGTDYKLVLLANFGTNKLTVKRRIYT